MTLEEMYHLLRNSHVQSQSIVETLEEPLVVLDNNLCVVSANPAFYGVFNAERSDTIGQSFFELGNGQWNSPDLRQLLANVVPNSVAVVGYQVSHDFPNIGHRTMLVSARRLAHPDGNSTQQILVVFDDVSERQKADVAKTILLAETRHRLKNLMAMVRALVHQTRAEGVTGEQYRDSFMGRLEALLNAQELIAANGSDTTLAALLDKTVGPIAGPRASVTPSPAVILNEYQVLPFCMTFHELATNALKYGALSNRDGRVHIHWKKEHEQGQASWVLEWREEGGPPVSAPSRRGFGTELIDYNCQAEGGTAVFDFNRAGLVVQITLPVGQ